MKAAQSIRRIACVAVWAVGYLAVATTASAQVGQFGGFPQGNTSLNRGGNPPEDAQPQELLIELGPSKPFEWTIGMEIDPGASGLQGVYATVPMPTDWPEQKVHLISANIPPTAKYALRPLGEGVQQMVIQIPQLAPGAKTRVTVTIGIDKSPILGPIQTDNLVIPKRPGRELALYLGNSPYIEANSGEVKKIAREVADSNPANAWETAERIYDRVREKISYQAGKMKSVRTALRDGTGDCEELTGAIVAVCRASKIPARCVWVPGHCYPEFYLENEEGVGGWFPCQAAGDRQFGMVTEDRPILQKGDRFEVPEKNELQRYVAEYLKIFKVIGPSDPKVQFIREVVNGQ